LVFDLPTTGPGGSYLFRLRLNIDNSTIDSRAEIVSFIVG